MNKELFSQEIFNDSDIRSNLPQLFKQFRFVRSARWAKLPSKNTSGVQQKTFTVFQHALRNFRAVNC